METSKNRHRMERKHRIISSSPPFSFQTQADSSDSKCEDGSKTSSFIHAYLSQDLQSQTNESSKSMKNLRSKTDPTLNFTLNFQSWSLGFCHECIGRTGRSSAQSEAQCRGKSCSSGAGAVRSSGCGDSNGRGSGRFQESFCEDFQVFFFFLHFLKLDSFDSLSAVLTKF